MKKYSIDFEWEIRDTRDITGGFMVGRSSLLVEASSKESAINAAIDFARSLPSWEFRRNNIDLENYREGKICRYYYLTMIKKIIVIKQEV